MDADPHDVTAEDEVELEPRQRASRRLARILADAEVLSNQELLAIQEEHPEEFLGDVLLREGILIESYLQGLLIRTLYVPWIAAECCTVPREVAELLSESFCREHVVVPISRARDFLTVACANPLAEEVIEEVGRITGLRVRTVLCSAEPLKKLIGAAYRGPEEEKTGPTEGEEEGAGELSPEVEAKAAELVGQLSAQAALGTNGPSPEDVPAQENPAEESTAETSAGADTEDGDGR